MKPKCIIIEAVEHHFTYEYLYIRLQSEYGCKCSIKLVFPKEDVKDFKKQ